jgi:hypothetical protein
MITDNKGKDTLFDGWYMCADCKVLGREQLECPCTLMLKNKWQTSRGKHTLTTKRLTKEKGEEHAMKKLPSESNRYDVFCLDDDHSDIEDETQCINVLQIGGGPKKHHTVEELKAQQNAKNAKREKKA